MSRSQRPGRGVVGATGRRATASKLSVSLALLWTVAIAAASPAEAARPPFDQVFPDEPLAPVATMLMHAPGGSYVYGDDNFWGIYHIHSAPAQALGSPQILHESGSGSYWRFRAGDGSVGGSKGAAYNGGLLLLENDRANYHYQDHTGSNVAGMTWSLFCRHPTGSPKVAGWNPLFTVAALNRQSKYGEGDQWYKPSLLKKRVDWDFGVMLHDGVPTFVDKTGKMVLDETTLSTAAIDDGQWHHVALRIVYDPTTQASENGRLSLFVDGHLAWNGWGSGKKPASAQSRSVKLRGSMRIGRVHNPESEYPGQSNYVDLDKLKAKDAAAYGKWDTYLKQSPRWLNSVADIDDVRVYQGPLSRAELARLSYAAQARRPPAGAGLRRAARPAELERQRDPVWRDGAR